MREFKRHAEPVDKHKPNYPVELQACYSKKYANHAIVGGDELDETLLVRTMQLPKAPEGDRKLSVVDAKFQDCQNLDQKNVDVSYTAVMNSLGDAILNAALDKNQQLVIATCKCLHKLTTDFLTGESREVIGADWLAGVERLQKMTKAVITLSDPTCDLDGSGREAVTWVDAQTGAGPEALLLTRLKKSAVYGPRLRDYWPIAASEKTMGPRIVTFTELLSTEQDMNALITKVVAPALASLPAFDEKLRKGATNDLKLALSAAFKRFVEDTKTKNVVDIPLLTSAKTQMKAAQQQLGTEYGDFSKFVTELEARTGNLEAILRREDLMFKVGKFRSKPSAGALAEVDGAIAAVQHDSLPEEMHETFTTGYTACRAYLFDNTMVDGFNGSGIGDAEKKILGQALRGAVFFNPKRVAAKEPAPDKRNKDLAHEELHVAMANADLRHAMKKVKDFTPPVTITEASLKPMHNVLDAVKRDADILLSKVNKLEFNSDIAIYSELCRSLGDAAIALWTNEGSNMCRQTEAVLKQKWEELAPFTGGHPEGGRSWKAVGPEFGTVTLEKIIKSLAKDTILKVDGGKIGAHADKCQEARTMSQSVDIFKLFYVCVCWVAGRHVVLKNLFFSIGSGVGSSLPILTQEI